MDFACEFAARDNVGKRLISFFGTGGGGDESHLKREGCSSLNETNLNISHALFDP